MDRNEIKQMLPVLQAFADGKKVQGFDEDTKTWNDLSDILLVCKPETYRIAPEKQAIPFDYETIKPYICEEVVFLNGEVYCIDSASITFVNLIHSIEPTIVRKVIYKDLMRYTFKSTGKDCCQKYV